MKTNKSVQAELKLRIDQQFLAVHFLMANRGISGAGKWGGGKEEGTLAIETVLQLPVPTLTFLHPNSREQRKGRTSI